MRNRGMFRRSRFGWGAWVLLCFGVAAGLVAVPARAQEDPAQQKISLDLVDADLRDAIALIFKDTPLNHVIGDGVYGTGVTLKLDQVPRERALKILLDSKGLTYTKEGGVYMIKPKAGAAPGGGMGAAPGGMGGPEAGMGMPPAGGGMGRPAAAGPGEGGAAAGGGRAGTLHQLKLTHLDPWYLRAILMNQLSQGGGGGGQFGGMGGGGMGGFGGGGMGGGMSMGGMGGGMGGMGGGMSMGGMGGGMGGMSMGGMGGGMGGSSFGGSGSGNGQSNSGSQVFRPTLRR